MTGQPVLAIMARAPSSPGKSRLIEALGTREGQALRSALLRDTFGSVASLNVDKAVLFTPSEYEREMRSLTPFPAVYLPQRGATLGQRMDQGIRDLLRLGFDGVVMIGSDLPTLPSAHVHDALKILARQPEALVLGPAEDGGYYLIGLTQSHPQLFVEIPWGTSRVLEHTCNTAAALGIAVERISPWYDIDSPGDLSRILRIERAGIAPLTRMWLSTAPSNVRARIDGARMIQRD
jgi:rSAM/selenodomain-associated transferase 1